MPLYEFKCTVCGAEFEEMLTVQEGKDRLKEPCPDCKEIALKRLIGVPAVHMRYSPMHPRHMRGQRGYNRKRK
jgi:putative FmdB family regulatory protein